MDPGFETVRHQSSPNVWWLIPVKSQFFWWLDHVNILFFPLKPAPQIHASCALRSAHACRKRASMMDPEAEARGPMSEMV